MEGTEQNILTCGSYLIRFAPTTTPFYVILQCVVVQILEIMIILEILNLEIFPRVGKNRIGWMTIDVRGISDR